MYSLGSGSLSRLIGVHPDLRKIIHRAIQITTRDFTVIEGVRPYSRQKILYARGSSKTMNSRHLVSKRTGFCYAADIAPYPTNGDYDRDGKLNIEDWDEYYPIASAMKQAAKELGIPLEWGGDWRSFKDGPHWQLPHAQYPK